MPVVRRFIRRWLGVESDIAALRREMDPGKVSFLAGKVDALLDSANRTNARVSELYEAKKRG